MVAKPRTLRRAEVVGLIAELIPSDVTYDDLATTDAGELTEALVANLDHDESNGPSEYQGLAIGDIVSAIIEFAEKHKGLPRDVEPGDEIEVKDDLVRTTLRIETATPNNIVSLVKHVAVEVEQAFGPNARWKGRKAVASMLVEPQGLKLVVVLDAEESPDEQWQQFLASLVNGQIRATEMAVADAEERERVEMEEAVQREKERQGQPVVMSVPSSTGVPPPGQSF